MQTLSLSSILLVSLCLAQIGHAQTTRRKPPAPAPSATQEPLPVSIVLKDGQTLKGKFVSANSKKLTIVVGASTQEMNSPRSRAGGAEQTTYGTAHHPPRYLTSSILSVVWRAAKDHLDKASQLAQ